MRTTQTSGGNRTTRRVRDTVVIGAGPAGATVAALLADRGHDVLLLERESTRRHHVGESLIPAANQVLNRLGLIDRLRDSSFPKKYSVQFVGESGRESEPFYFDEHDPLGMGYTWQVVRREFDDMLANRAAELGADVRHDTRVQRIVFSPDRNREVVVHIGSARQPGTQTVRCRVVVDASGQSCFLANRMGIRRPDPMLRNGTIWSWFHGAQRDSGRDEGATIIFSSRERRSWFWYIPLPDNVVSVGCTGSMRWMFDDGRSAEGVFARELSRCPAIARRLEFATAIEPFRTTRDFSYRASRAAGPGWVLVGDAYGFIDPVYSSGVFLALKSAEFAADAIHEAFKADDFSGDRLGAWQGEYDTGVSHFRRLVQAFYDPNFRFGNFLGEHPEYRNDLTDLLVGNVFKPGVGRMFDAITSTEVRE